MAQIVKSEAFEPGALVTACQGPWRSANGRPLRPGTMNSDRRGKSFRIVIAPSDR